MLRVVLGRATFFLAIIIVSVPLVSPSASAAGTACPSASNPLNAIYGLTKTSTTNASCVNLQLNAAQYNLMPNFDTQPTPDPTINAPIIVALPASAPNSVRVRFVKNESRNLVAISAITCVGANSLSGVGTTLGEVTLNEGTFCTLTITSPAAKDGADITYSATLSRNGGVYSLSSGNISGGVFTSDSTAPTVTISGAPATSNGPYTATFTFDEPVNGFALGDITVGNGTASGLTGADGDSVFTALITPTADGDATLDVAAGVAQDLAGNDNIAAGQVTTRFRDEDYVRTRTRRVIGNYLGRRGDQMTINEPDVVNRLSGGDSGTSSGPVGFAASGTLQNNQMSFSTSLRQVMGSSEAAKNKRRQELGQMMALGQQSVVGTTIDQGGGFDLWVQGKWVHVDQATRDSDIGLLYIGADYRFSPGLLVGLLGQVDWTDEEDTSQNFSINGRGWMIGPYLAARLHDNLLFNGRVAWGQSDNEVSPFNSYKDKFDTDRWLIRGQLTGDFNLANLHLAPSVGVIYFEDQQKAYTDSNGVFIPGQTISLGRVTFGPKISTNFTTTHGGLISPHISIKGIWDFDKADQVDIATGLAAGSDDDLRARVEAGLSARMVSGWTLGGEGFYDGIGADQLSIYGGSVSLTVPLN